MSMDQPFRRSLRNEGESDAVYKARRREAMESYVTELVKKWRIDFLAGSSEAVALFDEKMELAIASQQNAAENIKHIPETDDDLDMSKEAFILDEVTTPLTQLYDRELSTSPADFEADALETVHLEIAHSMPKDPHPGLTFPH